MAKGKKKAPATAEAEESTPLSERLELQRTNVICGPEMNYHVRFSAAPCTPRHLPPVTIHEQLT